MRKPEVGVPRGSRLLNWRIEGVLRVKLPILFGVFRGTRTSRLRADLVLASAYEQIVSHTVYRRVKGDPPLPNPPFLPVLCAE